MKKLVCGILVFLLLGCTPTSKNIIAQIEDKQYLLEVSKTNDQRSKGLSERINLDKNSGMLFVFENKATQTFWMKNTLIPLQIIFLDECKIIDIQEMTVEQDPANPRKTYVSALPSDMAIELSAGSLSQSSLNTTINGLCNKFPLQ